MDGTQHRAQAEPDGDLQHRAKQLLIPERTPTFHAGNPKNALAMLLRFPYPQHAQRASAETVSAEGGVG